jgi:hypothetical protein
VTLLDRLQKLTPFVPQKGAASMMCAGVIRVQLSFSVLILFGAGMLRDFWSRTTRPTALELPPH